MAVTLLLISVSDLRALAESRTPDAVAHRSLEGSLPPDFVARRSLERMLDGEAARWWNTYYVLRNTDQIIVGSCGFKGAPTSERVEIGYGISAECRNQGIATEAVRALLSLAFASGEVREVLAQVSPTNVASTRVVEKLAFSRNGMQVDKDGELLVQWVAAHAA